VTSVQETVSGSPICVAMCLTGFCTCTHRSSGQFLGFRGSYEDLGAVMEEGE
jgi:hypothetical protein